MNLHQVCLVTLASTVEGVGANVIFVLRPRVALGARLRLGLHWRLRRFGLCRRMLLLRGFRRRGGQRRGVQYRDFQRARLPRPWLAREGRQHPEHHRVHRGTPCQKHEQRPPGADIASQ